MEDQKIIALLFERSEQGMTELIAKYGKLLRRIAWNILGNALDAEECANDTYLSVWNAIPPEQPRSLAAFCCAIARNNALSRYQWDNAQKRNSHYDIALDELGESLPRPGKCRIRDRSQRIDRWHQSLSDCPAQRGSLSLCAPVLFCRQRGRAGCPNGQIPPQRFRPLVPNP